MSIKYSVYIFFNFLFMKKWVASLDSINGRNKDLTSDEYDNFTT